MQHAEGDGEVSPKRRHRFRRERLILPEQRQEVPAHAVLQDEPEVVLGLVPRVELEHQVV